MGLTAKQEIMQLALRTTKDLMDWQLCVDSKALYQNILESLRRGLIQETVNLKQQYLSPKYQLLDLERGVRELETEMKRKTERD